MSNEEQFNKGQAMLRQSLSVTPASTACAPTRLSGSIMDIGGCYGRLM
jgi:hypothetical protein